MRWCDDLELSTSWASRLKRRNAKKLKEGHGQGDVIDLMDSDDDDMETTKMARVSRRWSQLEESESGTSIRVMHRYCSNATITQRTLRPVECLVVK
jgi:hypothetical protein